MGAVSREMGKLYSVPKEGEFHEDSTRLGLQHTGIFVRGRRTTGEYGSIDIMHLTRDSLIDWLESRKDVDLARNTVLLILGHIP